MWTGIKYLYPLYQGGHLYAILWNYKEIDQGSYNGVNKHKIR